MGQDTYFTLLGADGLQTESLWSKGKLGLLWLACFRITDVVLDPEEGWIHEIHCDIETARRQFEGGVKVLRKTFPDTDFDVADRSVPTSGERKVPGIADFRRMLVETEASRAKLETCLLFQDFGGNHFDRVLAHALLGFSQPQCKMFYDQEDFDCGFRIPAGVPASGVMTWGDVLRALTIQGMETPVRPPTCLFTDVEYARSTWPLAGI